MKTTIGEGKNNGHKQKRLKTQEVTTLTDRQEGILGEHDKKMKQELVFSFPGGVISTTRQCSHKPTKSSPMLRSWKYQAEEEAGKQHKRESGFYM